MDRNIVVSGARMKRPSGGEDLIEWIFNEVA
jgi:hypothetical protein